jgi:nitroimidazol reductase NimA-like FMN-containing flavoprotein (pyridoxamine 5'-phosphate oxidase superfamily)
MRYRSVIGYGTARILEDAGEIRHGLACIVAHYGGAPDRIPDKAHEMVAVIRIDITEMTGKKSE